MNRNSPAICTPLFLCVTLCLMAGMMATTGAEKKTAGEGSPLQTLPATPTFYVATNGNDAWSGRLRVPNSKKTDGPLATPKKAFQTVKAPATIQIRDGLYFLTEPLALDPTHSGLVIEAFPGEKPILSGGKKITGWKETVIAGKKGWTADVSASEVKYFRELWVNGRRGVRARHPNHGYLSVAEVPEATPEWQQGQTRFRFKKDDLKNWKTITNAEIVVMSRWVESRLPINSLDVVQSFVTFDKRSVFQLGPGDPYYLEHAFEAIDEPGEWYFDRQAGKLYYLPLPGDQLNTAEVIVPQLTGLLRIEGSSPSTNTVNNVIFRGLTFSHNEWYFPEGFADAKDKPKVSPRSTAEVGGFSQAAIGVPAAVTAVGARNCLFDRCTFAHLGSYGLELGRGCQTNTVKDCSFVDLGAGGIKIGETMIRENAADQANFNTVTNSQLHDGGKVFHSAIGIWIGQSPGNRITHNLIHDFYYTGISIGWTWGYKNSAASNNLVEFNHVHHIGVLSDGDGPTLSDMGGIYTLGRQPGTRINNNLWHDIAGRSYGGWGIYLDEGSSGIAVTSNLVYRTTHGGFHQHYGETNLIVNNIFNFARDHQVQRTRPEPHSSFTFETNIIYFDTGVLLTGDWSGDKYTIDHNIYWDARPAADTKAMAMAGVSLEKWRERGHDQHSLIADPLFRNPRAGDPRLADFELNSNSPAFRLGFQPIDMSKAGPRWRN